ncbi:hypothetical protein HALDL1_00700 (plasmid) [Halobacterium sp. DL1]|jgi:hypothetical protein|nr:hypothetical protein HALDL1_00700 [Halobacterium sp. DL1]
MIGSGKASDRQESRGDSGVASLSQTQIVRADGGTDTSREDRERRHRILRSLRGQLERHPAVVSARGMPEGNYAEIEADLDPLYFGRDADTSSLRITWHPNPAFPPETGLEDRQRTSLAANFVFHYRESTGFDCGYHLEPNPHATGHLHYQERDAPEEAYAYNAFTLTASSPVGVLWELLDALETRLHA